MSIFKLDSKIYGAWSVEKEDRICIDPRWNDSSGGPCFSNAQNGMIPNFDSKNGGVSRAAKNSKRTRLNEAE